MPELHGADWFEDEAFTAYGLDAPAIAGLRAWADGLAARAASSGDDGTGSAPAQDDPYDDFDPDEYGR